MGTIKYVWAKLQNTSGMVGSGHHKTKHGSSRMCIQSSSWLLISRLDEDTKIYGHSSTDE